MAIKIINEYVDYRPFESECPNNTIYESGFWWKYIDETSPTEIEENKGKSIYLNIKNSSSQDKCFYIVTDKCKKHNVLYDFPQCAEVCPIDFCIIDDYKIETRDQLIEKKSWLNKDLRICQMF